MSFHDLIGESKKDWIIRSSRIMTAIFQIPWSRVKMNWDMGQSPDVKLFIKSILLSLSG
jgi:hypothetical protein